MELAVEDFGGTLLGRTIDVQQADIQNKPDIASAQVRAWIDSSVDLLVDGSAASSGLAVQEVAREKKTIYLGNGPAATEFTRQVLLPL